MSPRAATELECKKTSVAGAVRYPAGLAGYRTVGVADEMPAARCRCCSRCRYCSHCRCWW